MHSTTKSVVRTKSGCTYGQGQNYMPPTFWWGHKNTNMQNMRKIRETLELLALLQASWLSEVSTMKLICMVYGHVSLLIIFTEGNYMFFR